MEAVRLRELWWSKPQFSFSIEGDEGLEKLDPTSFWKSLVDLQTKSPSYPPKSELGKKYDFYFDCILRHPESNPAIITIDENGFIQSWNYKKLHRIVNFQVKEWLKKGVKSGQLVALVLPVGIDFYISLLTALRLGLMICYLCPETSLLSQRALFSLVESLQPTWMVSPKNSSWPSLDSYAQLPIDSKAESECASESSSYDANQIVQFSLSLYSHVPFSIVPLDAQTTYLHALRDGLITLNLQPGTIWASTLSCPLRTQPCSTLMTLLSGSTLFHIEEKALWNDPYLLKNEKLHLLEISPSLQKLWSKYPIPFGKQLMGYYQSPLNNHLPSWKAFVQINKLESIPTFSLLLDNSYGGALFLSKPTTEERSHFFKPSPALSWQLQSLNGRRDPSTTGMGYFTPLLPSKKDQPIPTHFIIAQMGNNLLLSSAGKPCQEGVTLPIEKIEVSLSKLPFVEYSFLQTNLKMGEVASYRTTLLIFTHPLKNSVGEETKREWGQLIKDQISNEVGFAFLPDQIEFYALVPPLKKGQLDRARCADQYSQGHLNKKRHDQTYQLISILKKFAQEGLCLTA